jgi:hypothetical protein
LAEILIYIGPAFSRRQGSKAGKIGLEEDMGLKRKQTVTLQKATFEKDLKDRMARLSEKGIKGRQADRDPLVKKMKADIKASNKRLSRITEEEKRTEEMARIKAERAAAPKKEKESAKAEKPKAAAKEGKPKKVKAPEGAQGPTTPGSHEEGKAPKKKAEPRAENKPAESKPEKSE